MSIRTRLLLPAALVLGLGAATGAFAADETAKPAETAQTQIPAPPEGKGQVVFFRPSAFAGAAVSYSIREGDKGVAKLGNGSYFVLVAEPGIHTYSNESESSDQLRLEIEAGETQYVKQTLGMGVMLYRPHLTQADEGAFRLHKLKESTKTASDKKPKDDAGDKADK